ncbi:MAG: type 4a pilus biogenesis protein PilO [Gammaproteobacteria bacterium]|nr:type 4a pilus biogenesis protein PilO [Gammaproteobacteria bacterium]
MDLSELNELDINNVGSWPLPVKMVLVVIICILVAGGAYWFDTQDQIAQLDKIGAEEKGLKDTLRIKAKKAANLDKLKQQLEEMRVSFKKLSRQLPNKTEVAALLVDISQTGLASGLEFELFKPLAENRKDFYADLPIEIRVKGSYHEFGNFVSGIAALPRIVTLHNINISPLQKNDAQGKLMMSATAKTYRYLDEEESSPQKKPKRR